MTAEEIKEREDLLAKINEQTNAALQTRATKDEFNAMKEQFKDLDVVQLRSLADPENGVMAIMKRMGDEVTQLKGQVAQTTSNKDTSVRGQIASWAEANKTALESIKGGTKADLTPLEIRVDSPMKPSTVYNSTTAANDAYLPKPEFAAGATEIVRVQPTFWDYIPKGRTNSAAYVWVNKRNPDGAAAFIAPGVAKPGVSFETSAEISNAKKIAVSEKVATELLQDIDGFASWVEMELTYQLRQKINTTLIGSVAASSTVPAGIQTLSTTYTLTTVKTASPNNWDAIRAGVAQLRSGNLQGNVTVFVNPIDKANMELTKATSQGQLFMPGALGATIVEDNNIAVGYAQFAMLDYYKTLIYKDFSITYGWENDDFTKNLVTVIGEMRLHNFVSENHTGAFIYDTFANIKTAITEVV